MKTTAVTSVLKEKESFLLLVHCNPDGDSIASGLALGLVLRALNKSVDIVCRDTIPVPFQFLPDSLNIRHDFFLADYDVVVTLDCGDIRRTGFSRRLKELIRKKKKLLINIDHHPKNDLHVLATHNYIDTAAPATAALVYRLIQELDVPIDHKIATCLLTGLYTDTGGFKHANTSPEVLTMASELLSHGARLRDITKHIAQLSTVARLKLWGIALSRLQHHKQFDVISTFLTHDDLATVGATEGDIGGIVSLMGTIPARVSMLAFQTPQKIIQVRMRTKNKEVNLDKLAVYLGGGGQRKSAGFTCHGAMQVKENRCLVIKK